MGLSALLRRVAEQARASDCGAGVLSDRERGDIDELVGRLRAAGLLLNAEVRAGHARAAGYAARPDWARARDATLDLLGGVRLARVLLRGRPLRGRVGAQDAVVSAQMTAAQKARADAEARAAGLAPSTFLRLALLARAGVPAPRALGREDADRIKGLAAQLRGSLGNAARLLEQPLRGSVAGQGETGVALLRAADDFVREARALLQGDDGAESAGWGG